MPKKFLNPAAVPLSEKKKPTPVEQAVFFKRNSGLWRVDEIGSLPVKSSKSSRMCDTKSSNKPSPNQKRKRKLELNEEPSNKEKELKRQRITSKKGEKSPVKTPITKEQPVKSKSKGLFSSKIVIESTPILRGKNRKKASMVTPPNSKLVKNPFSSPSSSTKKVKIALNLNRSQDTREYRKSIVNSPSIPFDAAKKPIKSLLKSRNSLPNCINPFYKC